MKFSEARAMITGAASGLGRAFALALVREGAAVAAVDTNQAGLAALELDAAGAPGRLSTYRADVSSPEGVVAAVQRAVTDLGSLNVLVNNAGIYRDGLLVRSDEARSYTLKMPVAQWRGVVDVDLTGPFLVAREVVGHMIDRRVQPAVVVNVSSISRSGNAGQANYAAAKAGIVAATRSWAMELATYGIRVAAIAPGFFRTPILEAMNKRVLGEWVAKVPLGRLGEPDELVLGLRFILECEYFNARCLEVDGGLTM